MDFSDYIVFVDESGDHNLAVVNPQFPVFVLAFCLIKKSDYTNIICPKVQDFKLKWFGHDSCVLHEREIRKDKYPFDFLKTASKKQEFMDELTAIIDAAPLHILPAVIRKEDLKSRYADPDNPYHLALLFCMEKLSRFLDVNGQCGKLTHVIFEKRGGEEDDTLELEFRRIMAGQHYLARNKMCNMEIQIISKATNSIGLQLADLVARPIGIKVMRPAQENRAYEIIVRKFLNGPDYFPRYAGMKIFP